MELCRKLEELITEIDDATEYAIATDTAFTREFSHLKRIRLVLQIALGFAERLERGGMRHV